MGKEGRDSWGISSQKKKCRNIGACNPWFADLLGRNVIDVYNIFWFAALFFRAK